MRAVLQRVKEASVTVDNQTIGRIGRGWLVLLGVAKTDRLNDVAYIADKTINLRAFPDQVGKMNRAIHEIGGAILVVSQFTLYGDCKKGRRPGFSEAATAELANELYSAYVHMLQTTGLTVVTGKFQADMQVSLINDGPVTLLLDSR